MKKTFRHIAFLVSMLAFVAMGVSCDNAKKTADNGEEKTEKSQDEDKSKAEEEYFYKEEAAELSEEVIRYRAMVAQYAVEENERCPKEGSYGLVEYCCDYTDEDSQVFRYFITCDGNVLGVDFSDLEARDAFETEWQMQALFTDEWFDKVPVSKRDLNDVLTICELAQVSIFFVYSDTVTGNTMSVIIDPYQMADVRSHIIL